MAQHDYSLANYGSTGADGLSYNIPGSGADGGLEDLGGLDVSGFLKNFSVGAQGLAGLAGAYSGYKQLGLLEDQYKASIADRNQQVANQAIITNKNLANQSSLAAQLYGNQYGTSAYDQYVKENTPQVSGAPI